MVELSLILVGTGKRGCSSLPLSVALSVTSLGEDPDSLTDGSGDTRDGDDRGEA